MEISLSVIRGAVEAEPVPTRGRGRQPCLQAWSMVPLLALLLLAVVGCELRAAAPPAQQRVPRIGYLAPNAPPHSEFVQAFLEGLTELGYRDGETIFVEFRYAEGREERYPELAAELVQLGVDVIVAPNTPAAQAAKAATATIPIVTIAVGDPVEFGLVSSLSRPGGNVTGTTTISTELIGKRLEILKEAVPEISYVGMIANFGNPIKARDLNEMQRLAPSLGLRVRAFPVETPDDFEEAFLAARREQVDSMFVAADPLTGRYRQTLVRLMAEYRLPAIYELSAFVEAGGLLSYDSYRLDLYRRAASYTDRILGGERPAELPFEHPTRFELLINRTTAATLNLAIPQSLLMRADRIIE